VVAFYVLAHSLLFALPCLFFFFLLCSVLRDLHSFPTRRSSDLSWSSTLASASRSWLQKPSCSLQSVVSVVYTVSGSPSACRSQRSEEHTSELQSRFDLVCRLLLEKKKQETERHNIYVAT